MALNPPLTENFEPHRADNDEFFILNRRGIEFEVKIDTLGKMSGKGIVMLSLTNIFRWSSQPSALC
jgi:hypothetical protein